MTTLNRPAQTPRSVHHVATIVLAGALAVVTSLLSPGDARLGAQAPDPCAPPNGNPIVCENQQAGDPDAQWDVVGAGDASIQGFSTDISVNRGQTVSFKIATDATSYQLDIYRMGYYGGFGARKVATVTPSATLPQVQPGCLTDAATGLIDCGNWDVSASWAVPATAVSGIYFAKVIRPDTGGASHIVFVVRDDTGHSDLLFQTSDTTWQAYNQYGGNSLYVGGPATSPGRAYKVSYNRPNTVRGTTPEDSVFNAEYPMVRWLEANGYNVSYSTGVDSDRSGAEILEHKAFLSVGHDEYWSGTQRANVEAARAAGVHLAFFSGNEMFWKTRWEDSISASAASHRTLVSYKETHENAKVDPLPNVWTGAWEDPRFSPPADGGRPANALTGTLFRVNSGTAALTVPAAEGKLRFWRNTAVATQAPGGSMTLSDGTIGYEWDEDVQNAFRPAGLIRLSNTTVAGVERLQDYGSTYATGTANHALTLYRHSSGALVFGAGTVQWSWGLDANHERGTSVPSVPMQQATVNLFADMGAQPLTLQTGLTTATPSSDTTKPESTITAPANNSGVPANTFITISGTAADGEGGVVAAVEVSPDGGATWLRATGRENWSLSWHTGSAGAVTLFSRAVDDAGNVEVPATGITLNVGAVPATCPCSLWHPSQQPNTPSAADSGPVEVGTRFRADASGYVTAIRFYKGAQNTGTHVGSLWTDGGLLLSTVIFAGETSSGWQEATLDTPVQVTANTTYVVSYHTNTGFYAADNGYFASAGVHNGLLYAPRDGEFGANGVFTYGASSFPVDAGSANYWVDVVFVTSIAPDTTPPTLLAVAPTNGASDASLSSVVSGTFNEKIDASTITSSTFELRDSTNALVPATAGYTTATRSATLTPTSPLAFSSTYTARLHGGSTGIKDAAGNALASDFTWSFTTGWPAPPPPAEGPGGPILVVSSAANPFTQYYAEILRAEGLNGFIVSDITGVTASTLTAHDVVILGEIALNPAQVSMFADWVSGGGKLIAMRPDKQLAGLLGLADAGSALSNAYLKVDTSAAPGAGIVGDTMQFHGTADRYTLNGASAVATLYSSATGATSAPAVTLRSVGASGGQAAAFTYDLARSIVYTRQGNPAWAGQERDGITPIRSDDMFFGGTDPDYVDRTKIAIPQADEQQRLLANLIGHLTAAERPVPRFWYFPRGEKAVVVMTGDDHGSNGTAGRFDVYKGDSPAGCHVNDWECVRATSYIYPGTPISNTQVAGYVADGFEIGVHVTTGCTDYTGASLQANFAGDLAAFSTLFPSAPPTRTSRTHCIVWSDYDTQPQVELANGIRLDTNYYYWPGPWVQDKPGFMTGSGMPMRFAKADGTLIDVYQAATHMTDESDQTWPFTIDTLLDRALGAEGYYGFFTANMHTDSVAHVGSEAIVASAQDRGVPVISARQLLDWVDGRNEATYSGPSWIGNSLTFTVSADARANGLQMLLPEVSGNRAVTAVTRDGNPITFTRQQIKGVNYVVFSSPQGAYSVAYTGDSAPPVLAALAVTPDATEATITWTTGEEASSRVAYGTSPNALSATMTSADLTTAHSVTIGGLTPGTTYYFRASSTDLLGNTGTAPAPPAIPMSFVTLTTATLGCPCSIWSSSTVPALASAADTNAVEVGVKFRPSADGYVTAIRFYKGALNTGTHVGNLWTSGGALLGTVTFTNETTTGWQQATLDQPVAVVANTTYVVSYHTTAGRFALDSQYFQGTGVTNGPLQALAEGVSGSNGVFVYGSSAFPTQSFDSSNYWVDLEFVTSVPPSSPPPVGLTDTTVADFQAGAVGAGAYVASAGGGELILAPSLAEEFSGAALPAAWSPTPWAIGGTSSVASGRATVDGALLKSDALFSPDQSLEFVATFSADAAQHGGFGLTLNADPWAMFSTGSGGSLTARTNDGITPMDTALAGNWLGTPHRFRIDWNSATVTFYIDGGIVATHPQAIASQMSLLFSDFGVGGGSLAVDSLRMGPYATTGTFTSRVLDAGTQTDWATAVSATQVPAGATLSLTARFGNTPVPDGTWSSFASLPLGTATVSGTSRYAQYRAELTGAGSNTPALESISFSGAGVPTPPGVSVTDATITEADSGTSYAEFTISLSGATPRQVSVAYATADVTAAAGSDYEPVSGTLVFPPGSTSRTVLVPITGDTLSEAHETFVFTLSAPVNATLADAQGTGTIQDDDLTPSLAIGDASVTETDSGTATAAFAVALSAASGQTVTVNYGTANGSATSPSDYIARSGTLTFAPGETTKSIAVSVAGDTLHESVESFQVNLSSPVHATIADGQGTGTIADNDPDLPVASISMAVDRTALFFGVTNNGALKTAAQPARVTFSNGIATWSVTSTAPWVQITGGSGTGAGIFTVAVKAGVYPAGTVLSGTVTVTAPGVPNSPISFPVELRAYASTTAPRGFVDTPVNNAQGIVGSIGVTGWAVDDIGVTQVTVWRNPVAGEAGSRANGKVFIGTAVLVEGTRPDVDAAQSQPFDFQAGWGYLLLTNMLPNHGNGTFTLFAYADDADGHRVLLGSRTITCENAHATKPFGAIDTPTQGQTISGSAYVNFGWVLTPTPNTVPKDGSTIMVYVDGVPVGHPTYNQFRSDIATIFPGRNNSDGAVGYYILDTTTLSNGVHTIEWGVTDDGGNVEGIGSRYFTVLNAASTSSITVERSSSTQSAMGQALEVRESAAAGDSVGATALSLESIPVSQNPAYRRTGFDQTASLEVIDADTDGVSRVDAREMERFQLTLGSPVVDSGDGHDGYAGYFVANGRLQVLPAGAFLDRKTGEFFWQPGVGFVGTYRMVFIRISGETREKIPVEVRITR